MHIVRIFIFLLTLLSLQASPVGNPAAPRLLQKGIMGSQDKGMEVRAGYLGNFVYDGRVKQTEYGSGRVDKLRQITNSALLTLSLLHRIDLYGIFGTSYAKADWRFRQGSVLVQRALLKTKASFLWVAGGRAILYEWGPLDLGLGGSYTSFRTSPSSMTVDGEAVSTRGSSYRSTGWQVNLALAYCIRIFTPYLGVNYAETRTEISGFSVPISSSLQGDNVFKDRNPWGFVIGCTLSNGNYFMLNLEGRLVDEEAFSVSCEFSF